MKTDSFFINAIEGEPSYVNTRDMNCNGAIESRKFIEQLWRQYRKHADRNFRTDAPKHFQQRFWEMYLGVALENSGFKIDKAKAKGPEFFTYIDTKKVWFEAIAPNQGTGEDAVPDMIFDPDVVTELPEVRIILRFTHAIYEKFKQYREYCKSNIIEANDSYIIAINSKGIRFIMGESGIPIVVKSVLPFGNPLVEFDVKTAEVVKSYHSYRDEIIKENNSPVSTSIFLDKGFGGITAVLCSSVGVTDHRLELGSDFILIHNPNAKNPLEKGSFKMGTEYWLDRDVLKNNGVT